VYHNLSIVSWAPRVCTPNGISIGLSVLHSSLITAPPYSLGGANEHPHRIRDSFGHRKSISQKAISTVLSVFAGLRLVTNRHTRSTAVLINPPDRGAENSDDRGYLAFVCPRGYLRNYISDLYQFLCILPMSVARSSSCGVAIRHELPVLLMTSCLYIMARNIGDAIVTQ